MSIFITQPSKQTRANDFNKHHLNCNRFFRLWLFYFISPLQGLSASLFGTQKVHKEENVFVPICLVEFGPATMEKKMIVILLIQDSGPSDETVQAETHVIDGVL